MKKTVNEVMVLMKAVRGRLAELSGLRSSVANVVSYYDAGAKKTIEPQYDVKMLDRRCVEIENWLLEAETKIKQSNAVVTIELEADVALLLKPIE